MASANTPSTLGRIKKPVSGIPEAHSTFIATGSATALADLAAAESTLKSTANVGDSRKWLDSLVNAEGGEECLTPKSEEHKIPPALCCPPAPRKPLKRKPPAASPLQGFYILPDSELQELFRPDLAKFSHRHLKKKRRSGEMSLPKMSENEDKAGRSHEEDNIETNSLYGEVH